jgi:hypothetical protein
MRIDILTLFPEIALAPPSESIHVDDEGHGKRKPEFLADLPADSKNSMSFVTRGGSA